MAKSPQQMCPHCGAPNDALKGIGPLCVISDTAYAQLRALLLGQLDRYSCEICRRTIDLRPTVIIVIGEKSEYFYCPGDRLIAAPEKLRQAFLTGLESEKARVHTFETLDDLRSSLAERVVALTGRIVQGIEKDRTNSKSLFEGDWRIFTSNHFVAAAIVLSTPLPGIDVAFSENSSPDTALEEIAAFQAKVWLAFCNSWSKELEEGRTLEHDLANYLAPDAMIHRAADEFLRITENLKLQTHTVLFCLEAVRASMCVWREVPNPRLKEWADLFVNQEIIRRIANEEAPPHLIAMEISAARARDTIPYEALFDACARMLAERGPDVLPYLSEMGEKLKYPDLAGQLVASLRPLPEKGQVVSAKKILETLHAVYKGGSPEPLLVTTSKLLVVLEEDRSPEVLGKIADGIREILGDDVDSWARVEAWLCKHLLEGGWSQAALDRIGVEAQAWEQELTPHIRGHLWMERSHALRVCGRGKEALAIAEAAISDSEAASEPIPSGWRRDLGILYREAGLHEQALDIFLQLLPDANHAFQIELLHSIAATHTLLGRHAEAIPYLERAASLARGPYGENRAVILATLAATKSATGEQRQALSLLRDIPIENVEHPTVLLPYASAWINLAQHPELLEKEDRKLLSDLVTKIKQVFDSTLQNGQMQIHLHTGRILAILSDLVPIERRNVFWELVDVGARQFEGGPDPLALLALAHDAWEKGAYEKARYYLLEVPSAVSERYKPERDVSLKIDSLSLLRWKLEKIVNLVAISGSYEDLRLIAELKRDMFGRIWASTSGLQEGILTSFIAPDSKTICSLGGPIAILEWVDDSDSVIGLATFITVDGTVIEADQKSISIDLHNLIARINQRLSVWHSGRAGDPFDLPDWKLFEKWLAEELEGRLPDGGRLVVIEHEEVAGLQWHVAASPRWKVSYAPSWSALLNARHPIISVNQETVGLAMVPKYRESSENIQALEKSVSRTIECATRIGWKLKSALYENCDRQALTEVLESSSVAKILCHGFVDPDDDVVALMVAHNGSLPLAESVAANTPMGRQYRFDWRDCQRLQHVSAVLFSAACSSGQSHRAGLGEELGLFSTLRRVGTRSLIAPRWDIDPKGVLPILDDALERYLRAGQGLGDALHEACFAASTEQPRWIAWALALEGDWT